VQCRSTEAEVQIRHRKLDERVLSQLADAEPSDVGIPLLVLDELISGAEKAQRSRALHT
jgi:predicted nucleic acid-binding protein